MGNCVTPDGYAAAEQTRFNAVLAANIIKSIPAVAEFALSANDAVKNFKKLWAISSRGLAIEEAQHGHLTNVYWPGENQFMAEFVQATPWEDQAVLARRYAGRMWAPIATGFAKKLKALECTKPRYCGASYSRAVQEVLVARGLTKANVITLADKIAFAEIEAIKSRDFERRKAAIAQRRGLIGQAATLLRSAGEGYAAAGADALGRANNAAQAIGYNIQSIFSQDPAFHRSALNRASTSSTGSSQINTSVDWGGGGIGGDDGTSIGDPNNDRITDNSVSSYTNSWNGYNANENHGNVGGGTGQDLVNAGIITIIGQGVAATIDLANADLADASNYSTDRLLTNDKPGPNTTAGNMTVTYLPTA